MFNAIKNLFSTPVRDDLAVSYQTAVASLLIEVMLADHHVDEAEEKQIKAILRDVSELGDDIDGLFTEARSGVEQAHDLYQFTKVINDVASLDQKIELLRGLWRVALSDGEVDAHEDVRIRRISELLFLSHSEFIQAKLYVQAEYKKE